MKSLIIYYSFEGNCARVADTLKSVLAGEILEIKTRDEKKRTGAAKFLWGGSQVMMKKKPALKPYTLDMNNWDLIILGTPVWVSSPSPAMVSFLDTAKISGKRIALYCCHGGGIGKAMEKFEALLPGNTIAGKIDFENASGMDAGELKQKISGWVKTLTP